MGISELLGQPDRLQGRNMRWTKISYSGSSSNAPSRVMLQKPDLRAESFNLLAEDAF